MWISCAVRMRRNNWWTSVLKERFCPQLSFTLNKRLLLSLNFPKNIYIFSKLNTPISYQQKRTCGKPRGQLLRFLRALQTSRVLHLMNRFHVAVRLYNKENSKADLCPLRRIRKEPFDVICCQNEYEAISLIAMRSKRYVICPGK